MADVAMPQHELLATLVHDVDGLRQYVLELPGHESITVRIDDSGPMHLLTRSGWAELGSTLGIDGGALVHLARAASMAYDVSGDFRVAEMRVGKAPAAGR